MSDKPVEKRRTVRVACLVPNGLLIRITVAGPDDGTGDGEKMMGREEPGYRLAGPDQRLMGTNARSRPDVAPGVTEVDAEWAARWFEQNKLNPIVTQRQVWILEENPTP